MTTTGRFPCKLAKRRSLTSRHHKDFATFFGAIDGGIDDFAGPLESELENLMTLNSQCFHFHKG